MTASVPVHKPLWDRVCFRDGERGLNAWGQTCLHLPNSSQTSLPEAGKEEVAQKSHPMDPPPYWCPYQAWSWSSGYQSGSWPGVEELCSNGATWGTRVGIMGSCAQAPDGTESSQAKMETGSEKALEMPSAMRCTCQAHLKGLEPSGETGCLEKGWHPHGPRVWCPAILKGLLKRA